MQNKIKEVLRLTVECVTTLIRPLECSSEAGVFTGRQRARLQSQARSKELNRNLMTRTNHTEYQQAKNAEWGPAISTLRLPIFLVFILMKDFRNDRFQ